MSFKFRSLPLLPFRWVLGWNFLEFCGTLSFFGLEFFRKCQKRIPDLRIPLLPASVLEVLGVVISKLLLWIKMGLFSTEVHIMYLFRSWQNGNTSRTLNKILWQNSDHYLVEGAPQKMYRWFIFDWPTLLRAGRLYWGV